jgi:hypothetical protein
VDGELRSDEFRILQARFSSGLRLRELRSLALVFASIAEIAPPDRDTKRGYVPLIKYFRANWAVLSPFLPFVQLRDENDFPIDGRREGLERSMRDFVNGK